MKYGLVINPDAAQALAAMPTEPHELFIMACLDLQTGPYTLGVMDRQDGPFVTLTQAVGGMGFIVYDVDETRAVVTVTQVITLV